MNELPEPTIAAEDYGPVATSARDVDAVLRKLVSLNTTDFAAVKETASQLYLLYREFHNKIVALRNESAFFKKIFDHDERNNAVYCFGIIKDDIGAVADFCLEKFVAELIPELATNGPRMTPDFMENFSAMLREFCNGADEQPNATLSKALVRMDPENTFWLEEFRDKVQRAPDSFDALFLEEFGGTCINLDIIELRRKICQLCSNTSVDDEGEGEIEEIERDLLCLGTGMDRQDVWTLRADVNDRAERIHSERQELWARMWIVLQTISSSAYWVPGCKSGQTNMAVGSFLNEAQPSLANRFRMDIGQKKLTVDTAQHAVVSMDASTVASLLLNSVANASKHGRASVIDISTETRNDTLAIIIDDNGTGFEDEVGLRLCELGFSGADSSGLGLAHADKRMAAFGGSFEAQGHGGLNNASGSQGARIILTVPVT